MRDLEKFLATCASANDLDRACDVPPLSEYDALVLDAMAGARPTAEQRRVWRHVSDQPYPDAAPAMFAECCGRGSGKSTRLVKHALFHLLCLRHWEHAMVGTRVYATVTAPTTKQSAECVRMAAAVLRSWSSLGIEFTIVGETSDAPEIQVIRPARPCTMVLAVAVEGDTGRGRAHCGLFRTEAGSSRTGAGFVATDIRTHAAIAPRIPQFPRGQVCLESTPGPPSGVFFDVVTNPRGATVVRGSSSLFNPVGMPEAACRRMVPDPRQYAQEILAKVWGLSGDGWNDADAVLEALDRTNAWCGGTFSCDAAYTAIDVAHVKDGMAYIRVVAVDVATRAGESVRHIVVTHVERWQGSKDAPLQTKAIVKHALAMARGGPILCDAYYAHDVAAELETAGYRECKDFEKLRGRRYMVSAMHAAAQTARYRTVRELYSGRRIHIPFTEPGRLLAKEDAELTATELGSGLLRFEGLRTDDLSKALSLAVEAAHHSRRADVIDGEGGHVERELLGITWGESGINVRGRYVRVLQNGRRIPVAPPLGSVDFPDHALKCASEGIFDANIIAFLKQRRAEGEAVPPFPDGDAPAETAVWCSTRRAWVSPDVAITPLRSALVEGQSDDVQRRVEAARALADAEAARLAVTKPATNDELERAAINVPVKGG